MRHSPASFMWERSDAKVSRNISAGMALNFLDRVEAARLLLAGLAFHSMVEAAWLTLAEIALGAARITLAGIGFVSRVEAAG